MCEEPFQISRSVIKYANSIWPYSLQTLLLPLIWYKPNWRTFSTYFSYQTNFWFGSCSYLSSHSYEWKKNCIFKLFFKFSFFKTYYVDDILACISKLQDILDTSNPYNNNLKFDEELEKNNAIPFLDINAYIIRTNENIIIIKTKFFWRILNFHSQHNTPTYF